MNQYMTHAAVATAALFVAAMIPHAQTAATTQRFPQFENEDVKVWKSVVYPNAPLTMHRSRTSKGDYCAERRRDEDRRKHGRVAGSSVGDGPCLLASDECAGDDPCGCERRQGTDRSDGCGA